MEKKNYSYMVMTIILLLQIIGFYILKMLNDRYGLQSLWFGILFIFFIDVLAIYFLKKIKSKETNLFSDLANIISSGILLLIFTITFLIYTTLNARNLNKAENGTIYFLPLISVSVVFSTVFLLKD